MRSLAFIIIGLTFGILVTLVFLNSNSGILGPKSKTISTEQSGEPTPLVSPVADKEKEPEYQVVTAGGKLTFNKFQVQIPPNWTYEKTSSYEDQETLILTGGGTTITFNQAATGGNVCFFPGDPPTEIIFVTEYPFYENVKTFDGTLLRRAGDSASSKEYTVCSKGAENFLAPTTYGHISITTEPDPSAQILKNIDQILASLKKI